MLNINHRTVIIFGLGLFGEKILKSLIDRWELIAVDIDKERINKLKEEFKDRENITFINGDASSILTWKKINFKNVSCVISAIQDVDVALEICRIGRESFKLPKEVQFIVLLIKNEREEEFKNFNVEIVNPVDITAKTVISLVEKSFKIPQNVGLGKGEIVETTILANSHLVDRELKHFKSTRWRVAAIYRNGKFILPTKDTALKVGDRVVISGYPSVVESIVNIFLKGVPQFPLQYGRDIAVPFSPLNLKIIKEAEYLRKNSKANRLQIFPWKKRYKKIINEKLQEILNNQFYEIKEKPAKSYRDLLYPEKENIGVAVISFGLTRVDKFLYKFFDFIRMKRIYYNFKLKKLFMSAEKPFLVSRSSFPYTRLIVSLNSSNPAITLEIGLELFRISKIPLEVIYITKPKELRGEIDKEELNLIKELVNDFGHIYRTKIDLVIKEGNPIKRTLSYLEEKDYKKVLLILSFDKNDKYSIFNPNIQYELTIRTDISVLLIPAKKEVLSNQLSP